MIPEKPPLEDDTPVPFSAFAPQKEPSLKKPLLIATGAFLLGVGGFMFWADRVNTERAQQAFAAATDFVAQGNLPRATEKLDEALRYKENAVYLYTKYLVLGSEEKFHEAGLHLEKAVQRDPANAGYAYEAGTFFFSQVPDDEKALRYLQQAVALEPKNSDYQLAYGAGLIALGRSEEGRKRLEALAKSDPDYYAVWDELANLYRGLKQPKKAIATRLQAIRQFPNDAYHWYWLANTYDEQGNKPKAVEAYQKSIALAPEWGASASYRIAALTGRKVPEQYREIVEDSLPVMYKNTHAYVEATVVGCRGTFLLDTGATDTLLYRHFIEKNGIEMGDDNPTMHYQTANGILSAPVVYAAVKLGQFSLEKVRVAVIASPGADRDTDGIIGMNILSHFNVKMDNLRGTLILSRK